MEVGLCWILAVALCVAPLALSQNCDGFSPRPMDTVATEGGMACLYCDYPSVENIVWERDSTSIEADGELKDVCNCMARPGRPIRLCFPSVQPDNADRYTCRATVGFGVTQDCSARLLLAGAPNITNKPDNPDVVIASGATQTITVNYDPGNPPATVQWSKDGQLINGSSDPRVSAAPNTTILRLTNNDPSIRGRYLVNVSNIGGSDTFQYNVKAVFGPNVTITSSSSPLQLTCSARGYPVMDRVAWQTDGGVTVSGSVDEINSMESATFDFSLTSTLDLDRDRCNSHFYRCLVSSGSITRSTSITCQIETVPVPQNFRIAIINTTAVLANWTRNGTLSYVIEFQLQGDNMESRLGEDTWVSHPATAPPLIITDLIEGRTYSFRARSRNINGVMSDYTQVVMATPCRAPSTEVTGVLAEPTNVGRRSAIRISWQPSKESGVLGYRLYVTPNIPSPIRIDGQDNTNYTLVPSSCDQLTYFMSVAAWNGCGSAGPRSATVQLTCISSNRIFIQNLIPHDTGITVIWESDREDQLISVLIIVIEQDVSSNDQPRTLTYDISSQTATGRCVGRLKPETSYRVCVNASYHDLGMQQDCSFSVTRRRDEMTNGIQCSSPTTTTGTSPTVMVPDWVIAVIVVGVLMIIAALFCVIGLCFACRNNDEKPNDFDSDSSMHTGSIRDGPMREMSPSRSCLSYHVKGHSVNWNEHVDTLRQMDTGGTSV